MAVKVEPYTIDLLDKALTVNASLRKVKNIYIYQGNAKPFVLRGQTHVLVISDFGNFKSAITAQLKQQIGEKNVYDLGEPTASGIKGSITEEGDYVPSVLVQCAGKVTVIDEWNSIDYHAKKTLLDLLENQQINRTLGRKVNKNYVHSDETGFIEFSVIDNTIHLKALFSNVAYAMHYPISRGDEEMAKALLSRFSPVFIPSSKELTRAGISGKFRVTVHDYSCLIESITIPKEVDEEVNSAYDEFLNENNLWPTDEHNYGFVSRTRAEITRYGICNYLKDKKPKYKGKKGLTITIDDAKYFKDAFKYISPLLNNFSQTEGQSVTIQIRDLLNKYPDMKQKEIAERVGKGEPYISKCLKKIRGK